MDCRRLSTADEVAEPLARRRPRLVADRVTVAGPPTRRMQVLRIVARGWAAADTRRVDQPDAGRAPRGRPVGARLRRGRRSQGWRLRRDPRTAADGRGRTSLRHSAGRADDPRSRPRGGCLGTPADPGDPVPRLRAQRHRPATWRGGDACHSSRPASTSTRWSCASPGYAYQKGFGGHFHNDNALGGLRDLPGVVVASPARGSDAAAMLRTCAAAAKTDGTVCLFLEPIALYHTRDLHTPGDGGWLSTYIGPSGWAGVHVPIGSGRVARDGTDVLLVTWANGLYMSLRVAERLRLEGLSCRVFDLRWLAPLPVDDLLANAHDVGRVVVVDETRRQGGVGEGVVAALVEGGLRRPDRARRRSGLVRPARRCGEPRARVRGRHLRRRAGDPPAMTVQPAGEQRARLATSARRCGRHPGPSATPVRPVPRRRPRRPEATRRPVAG